MVIVQKIYFCVWILIHVMYWLLHQLGQNARYFWRHVWKGINSCSPAQSPEGELRCLMERVQSLDKVPKHVAFSICGHYDGQGLGPTGFFSELSNFIKILFGIGPTRVEPHFETNPDHLYNLARLITWAWASGIRVISLYDYHGRLKMAHKELSAYIQEELRQSSWILHNLVQSEKEPSAGDIVDVAEDDEPKVKFYNVPKKNGHTNGILNGNANGVKPGVTLHINLFSNEDGKLGIVRVAQDICEMSVKETETTDDMRNWEGTNLEVTESNLDSRLTKALGIGANLSVEPDILVIMGNLKSTLGFLPWHIRLTEIHWIPRLPVIEMRDFLSVLEKYSGCQQRFGT